MKEYKYRPVRFYTVTYAATWFFWVLAITFHQGLICSALMLLGLISPAVVAMTLVFTSGSDALKKDLKRKLLGFHHLKPWNIILAIVV